MGPDKDMTAPPGRAQAVPPFEERDILPDIILPRENEKLVVMSQQLKGKNLALLMCADPSQPQCLAALRYLRDRYSILDPTAHVYVITVTEPEENAAISAAESLPFALLSDLELQVAGGLGVSHNLPDDREFSSQDIFTIVLADANRRILSLDRNLTSLDALKRLIDSLSVIPVPDPERVGAIAPVLYLKSVFEPTFCQTLIRAWQTQGNQRSGVIQASGLVGESVHTFDASFKERRDHLVVDPDLVEGINLRFARRVLPEIEKALPRQVSGYEQLKVVCYEANQSGHFTAHRDNIHDRHKHRRFALTLNLNSDEYEGGDLRFPEYGSGLYRPSSGDAVVFSCSLLHEVTKVSAGRRFALLTFMYDEQSRQLNPRYARHK